MKLTKLQQKQQPKPDLLGLWPSLLIELTFFMGVAFLNVFYFKAKTELIFSLYSSFDVLIYNFDIFFLQEQLSCTNKGEKQIKYCVRKHAVSFARLNIFIKRYNTKMHLLQFSISYIIWESQLSTGEILVNKNLMNLLTNQKFCWKLKEAYLAMYLIKISVHSRFTQLKIIRKK